MQNDVEKKTPELILHEDTSVGLFPRQKKSRGKLFISVVAAIVALTSFMVFYLLMPQVVIEDFDLPDHCASPKLNGLEISAKSTHLIGLDRLNKEQLVTFNCKGYKPIEVKFSLSLTDVKRISLLFEKFPVLVELSSDPSGAEIFYGERKLGLTPLKRSFEWGMQSLKLIKKNFKPVQINLKLLPGQDIKKEVRLEYQSDIKNGTICLSAINGNGSVFCGVLPQRFSQGKSIIKDYALNLNWMICGISGTADYCEQETPENIAELSDPCQSLKTREDRKWRSPNINELYSIVGSPIHGMIEESVKKSKFMHYAFGGKDYKDHILIKFMPEMNIFTVRDLENEKVAKKIEFKETDTFFGLPICVEEI